MACSGRIRQAGITYYADPADGQRLKLSGMHWTVSGASAITTLRCQQASCPDDRIWRSVRNQTGAA